MGTNSINATFKYTLPTSGKILETNEGNISNLAGNCKFIQTETFDFNDSELTSNNSSDKSSISVSFQDQGAYQKSIDDFVTEHNTVKSGLEEYLNGKDGLANRYKEVSDAVSYMKERIDIENEIGNNLLDKEKMYQNSYYAREMETL